MGLNVRLRLRRVVRFSTGLMTTALVCLPGMAVGQHGHGRPAEPPAVLNSAEGTAEIGTLGEAAYRIDVPEKWNHSLVIFFHGYAEHSVQFREDERPSQQVEPMLQRGYAVAQSGYSDTGWALGAGYRDSESLRQYFVRQYGKPRETFAAGMSMGGALTMIVMELDSRTYAGGLDLCGAVGPSLVHMNRRFALRAAFDFYFPGLMPPLDPVPAGFTETEALRQKALAALRGNAPSASAMRALTGLHTDAEVARAMVYYTYNIADLQQKAGGNPFSNRNVVYTGTEAEALPEARAQARFEPRPEWRPDPHAAVRADEALNDGVRRYRADPAAETYLAAHYSPSGHLVHPMLAVTTAYDPLIPASELELYSDEVARAGSSDHYVQQYVHREGHCAFTPDEIGRSFDELVRWVHTGAPPSPGWLRVAEEARHTGEEVRPH